MNCVVVDFAASTGGATSILLSFYNYLINSGNTDNWIFMLSSPLIEEKDNIKVVLLDKEKKSRFRRLMFDLFYGHRYIKRFNPDVVFYLQNTFINGVKTTQVAYMDQPIPFQDEMHFSFFKANQRKYAVYQYIIGSFIKSACKKADCIIVQTEWMKDAIKDKCRILEDKIIKIAPDVNIDYSNIKDDIKWDNNKFFYPANKMFYKNHICITRAVEILQKEGIDRFSVEYTLDNNQPPDNSYIINVGKISHREVVEKLQQTTLIFPSFIESYGLPLAEAKKVGGLILAADTSFSREILTGYNNSYFFNPFDPTELANLMEKVISGNIIKKEFKNNAAVNNDINSWEKVVYEIKKTTERKVDSI